MIDPPENFIPFSTTRSEKDFDTIEVNLKGFGFTEDDLKVEVEKKILTISGKRTLENKKCSQFSQTFPLSKNHSDPTQFILRFGGEVLYVAMPKKNPLVVTQVVKENNNKIQNAALNLCLAAAVLVALSVSIFKTILRDRDGGGGGH
ncbi:hypothetical protein ACFE04_027616 [Oxalis oulophora]